MKLIKGKKEKLEKLATEIIAGKAKEFSAEKGKVIFGIVGGLSVQGVFKNLKTAPISWRNIHIFMIDERFVPLDSQESNFKMAKKNFISDLIEKGVLPKDNVHPFKYDSSKKDGGIKDYEKEFLKCGLGLRSRFDVGGNAYDIILLGAGEDGHIASLFPNHSSIKDNSEYFIKVENSPKPPSRRISASKKLLARTDTCLLLFFGEEKKAAYNLFLNPEAEDEDCPAKIIKDIKNSYILSNFS